MEPIQLLNADAGTRNSFARKMAFFNLIESNNTINSSVDCEVFANVCAGTSDFGAASLANENFSITDLLATKALHTKALAGVVVDVLTRTTCFNV